MTNVENVCFLKKMLSDENHDTCSNLKLMSTLDEGTVYRFVL